MAGSKPVLGVASARENRARDRDAEKERKTGN
jgi:hypothetical protein